MSEILQYDRDASERLLAMYLTPDIVSQRGQLLEAIDPKAGERVLDVGTGPGFLAAEIGESVGPSGHVYGIDLSEALLQVANVQGTHQPWVAFCYGDAARIPFPDNYFDIVISTQVLEYISNVKMGLLEFQRVLKPGGRVVLLDTDWDSIVWHTTDRMRMNRILSVWEEHAADPHLPRTLSSKLLQAGFRIEAHQVIPMFNPIFGQNTFSNRLIDLISSFVTNRKGITPYDTDSWASELRHLGENNEYFFSLNRYLFTAIKP